MAVHANDIVLGSLEDMQLSAPIRVSGKSRVPVGPERRDLSARNQSCLWPEAVIAYVIDEDITAEQLQNILHAIGEWNDKTVMSLVARAMERNYVRFANVASGFCRSKIGMEGGGQWISLPPQGCDAYAVAHEIGHAVGLWHEHQREDRAGCSAR